MVKNVDIRNTAYMQRYIMKPHRVLIYVTIQTWKIINSNVNHRPMNGIVTAMNELYVCEAKDICVEGTKCCMAKPHQHQHICDVYHECNLTDKMYRVKCIPHEIKWDGESNEL